MSNANTHTCTLSHAPTHPSHALTHSLTHQRTNAHTHIFGITHTLLRPYLLTHAPAHSNTQSLTPSDIRTHTLGTRKVSLRNDAFTSKQRTQMQNIDSGQNLSLPRTNTHRYVITHVATYAQTNLRQTTPCVPFIGRAYLCTRSRWFSLLPSTKTHVSSTIVHPRDVLSSRPDTHDRSSACRCKPLDN